MNRMFDMVHCGNVPEYMFLDFTCPRCTKRVTLQQTIPHRSVCCTCGTELILVKNTVIASVTVDGIFPEKIPLRELTHGETLLLFCDDCRTPVRYIVGDVGTYKCDCQYAKITYNKVTRNITVWKEE